MEIEDVAFADKYELFGCIQCGKCTGGCPVSLKSDLNSRRLVRKGLLSENEEVLGDIEYIWDCTTCSTCTLRCPKGIEPSEVIIGMRTLLIEDANVPNTIQEALESTYKDGNPWGRARSKRSEWAEGLDIKNISKGDEAELIYYVGCTPCYDPRIQSVAHSLVKIFNAAGVDFGTLGNKESCCGNEVRRMGEVGLFEMMIEDNLQVYEKFNIQKMVTTSPHCYNTFKNEYEGATFEVQHYTQLVADLIDSGKLEFSKELDQTITYQDPCFLGKQNKVFEEPRKILESIPGATFIDFDRSKERSLCCEGGGGRMWVEATGEGERNSEIRARDADEMGASIIAVSCPFCLLTMEDAVKMAGYEEKIQVRDIAEIIAELI
ncbi:MAG: (Fe-S)-binding protein [Halobacteriota archaeon]|nr:(Fe-S)-binding protein [Halobacteriota archaeon]